MWAVEGASGTGEAAESLWAASAAVPAPGGEPLSTTVQADVAIVGGGLTGLSAALHLAELGRKVVVLEAHEVGYGASGRNGGQVNPGLRLNEQQAVARHGEAGRGLYRMGEEATDFLAAVIARLNLPCRFQRPGVVRLAHHPAAFATLRDAHAALVARGIAARLLDARQAAEVVGSHRYVGGMIDPRGGNVHPLDLVRGLARAAMAAGAAVHPRTPVRTLARAADRWKVECGNGAVLAGEVVVATNGYSDALIPGLARSVLPVNSFQIATAPLAADLHDRILPSGHAAFDSRRLILYFRKSPDARVVLGGRASFSSRLDPARARRDYDVLREVLVGIFPQLRDVPIAYRWTGLVCITPDFIPHYHNPTAGLHVLLGFNGKGVALSTRAGAWLARKIAREPDSCAIPPTPIAPVPLHALRAPVAHLIMQWHRVMDVVGR